MFLLCVVRLLERRTCTFSFSAQRSAGRSRSDCFKMFATTFEEQIFNKKTEKNLSTVGQKIPLKENTQKSLEQKYSDTIRTLNGLQSNAVLFQECISEQDNMSKMLKSIEYVTRSGLSLEEVDKLSIIHVSGTKGKGSTCAITESILRTHGVKTGFFSSPHLVSVTERIRINGQPIGKEQFCQHFWPVYRRLQETQKDPSDMPGYFQFLFTLSLHVFLAEKVDCLVLEVGIGGYLDTTNIIRNTKTVGITSLGLEHTNLLGNTLEEIAWQKAGIIKDKSKVYTHVVQPECLEVIQKVAKEKNAEVFIVPALKDYRMDNKDIELLEENEVIELNGSLAIQLACDWLRNHDIVPYNQFPPNSTLITKDIIKGIESSHWPGRCQRVQFKNLNLHFDGAHTLESIQVCTKWFKRVTKTSKNPKVLIFNRTGIADSYPLLQCLFENLEFDVACFTPNFATAHTENRKDIHSVWKSQEQVERTPIHASNWNNLCSKANKTTNSHVFPSLQRVFDFILKEFGNEKKIDILVTGSVHLIGAAICAINDLPDCPSRKQ